MHFNLKVNRKLKTQKRELHGGGPWISKTEGLTFINRSIEGDTNVFAHH
jgi:hypothetical protein